MRKLGIRWRYTLSFLLVLIIPLSTFSLYNFYFFNNKLKEQVINSNLGSLSTMQNFMDMQLAQMQAIATQMSIDSDYRPFQLLSDPMRAYTMLNKLRSLLLSNSFVSQLYVFYKDDAYFYSANGSYTRHSFRYNFSFIDCDVNTIMDDLYTLDKPTVCTADIVMASESQPSRYLILAYPLWYSAQGSVSFGSLAILINTAHIDRIVQEKVAASQSQFLMIDNAGQLIYCSNNQIQPDMPSLLSQVQQLQPMQVGSYKHHGSNYLIATLPSETLDYQYCMLISTDQIMKPVEQAQYIALAVVMGALVVGLAFIVLLVIYNYDPIKKLKQTMGRPDAELESSLNELDGIRLYMIRLIAAKQNLESVSQSNESAVRQYFFYRILRGEINDEDLTTHQAPIQIQVSEARFCVAILEIAGLQQLSYEEKMVLAASIEHSLAAAENVVAMLDLDGRRMIVLVISSAGATDLQEGFVRIIDQINRQGKLSATAGLGCAYPSLAEVRKSYLEASAALDYRLVGGEQRLFYFPDLFEKHVNFGCLYDKLGDRLEIAVLQGQDDQAVHLIHELIDEMTTQRMPLFAARLFLHDVINSMTHRAAQRFGSSTLAYDLDIYRIEKINNIRELAEAVCNAIKKLCQSVKEYHEHGYEERRLYQEYLHKNGLSDMFSVAGMARDFKCSQPSLNQHFKQCMNTTIWDAVVSMRIERAKQLLSETSMTLQEIVNLIGYKDTSNFVRKFRNVTGKTPGEYRLLYTMPNQPGLE